MPSEATQLDLSLWQEHLDERLPHRPMLRPDEVAKFLGIDQKTVARIFDKEVADAVPLMGITINGAADERGHRRILRDSAILYWASKANYAPDEFRARILEVLRNCSASDLLTIQQSIGELLRHKQA